VNLVLEYIKYRWKGKRRHGIHSPFIYDFTDNCLRTEYSVYSDLAVTELFSRLNSSTETIEIEDFGAGSKKLSKTRKIKDIFKTSSSSGKYGKLMFKATHHYKPKNILEFGTSLGVGSILMHKGNPKSAITTIEGCKNTHRIAKQNFENLGININSLNSTFDEFLKKENDVKYDLIFLDGHHDGAATLDYLERLKNNYHNDTIIILDDIRWSEDMFRAWEQIKNSDKFNVTVDLFRMGLITPRQQQQKEHFTILL
jgi:predicted O-methyltransferase YrrM